MSMPLNHENVQAEGVSAPSRVTPPPLPTPPPMPPGHPTDVEDELVDDSLDEDDDEYEDDEDEDEIPASRRRSLIFLASSCVCSMLVHGLTLILMGLWLLPVVNKDTRQEIVSSVEERPDEVITQTLEEEIRPSTDLSLVSTAMSAVQGAMGSVSALAEPQQLSQQVTVSTVATDVKVEVGEVNVFASNGKHLSQELPEGTLGEAAAIADSYQEAMDRITQEILNRLSKGKVLVVWLMDESQSMEDDREEISARIERVYQELGIASTARGDSLATAVCSYGKGFNVHTPVPTSDHVKIMEAMHGIQNDPSGDEMQCQAVSQAIQRYRGIAQQTQRQMLLIMVSDESGDPATNVQYLESTIAEARSARCAIYVLGRESVFGYPYAYMVWRDPEKPQFGPYYLRIDRGPETPFPEQLQWDCFNKRNDAQPAGFGPYEQARMARQTGGVFFMLPSPEVQLLNRSNRKYALEALRPYLPDLSSRSDYAFERDKSELRAVVWKIISDLNPWNHQISRQLELPRGSFSIQPSEFNKQALDCIEHAKRVVIYLQEAEKALDKVKPLKDRESSPRWRANFDLIYAQVLGYQVRWFEYGAYLDAFREQPKPIKNVLGPTRPTNGWSLAFRKETISDIVNGERRERSEEILRQVIREHEGTPYAVRAQWELGRPFGVTLNEHHAPPPTVNVPGRPGVKPPTPPKL